MRIILDLGALAGGAIPAATLQVRPDEIDLETPAVASSRGIVAMDAGAARIGDGASERAPAPMSEQPSVANALNAGQAPESVDSTDRPAATARIAPAQVSAGSAGSAPIVIDEFEVPSAIANRMR